MHRPLVRLCRTLLGSAIIAAFAACPAIADDAVVPFAAHHARYKLSLGRSDGSKAPAAVDGLIDYDFSGSACDGYATQFRQLTDLQPPEGESHVSEMKSATFENGDDKQFRFDTQTTNDGHVEAILGSAMRKDDGTLAIDLQKPAAIKTTLPTALFPTEHLERIIATARQGGKTLSVAVYDGSDTGQKVFDTFTVIGAAATAPPDDKSGTIDALKTMRRWPVTISYFEQGKDNVQPSYVMAFDLFEDGISRALRLDYGNFTLVGSLIDLDLHPSSPCPKP